MAAKAAMELEPPPPKRPCVARAGADTSSGSDPQLHAPEFEFDPPAASDSLQPGGRFVNDVLLNLHTRTHLTTDDSDNEDSEDAFEGDAVEAADSIDPETNDFSGGEDVDMVSDVDPREGILSDWEILAEEFIVGAEKLRKFEPSFLHTPLLTGVFMLRRVFYLGP